MWWSYPGMILSWALWRSSHGPCDDPLLGPVMLRLRSWALWWSSHGPCDDPLLGPVMILPCALCRSAPGPCNHPLLGPAIILSWALWWSSFGPCDDPELMSPVMPDGLWSFQPYSPLPRIIGWFININTK